MSVPSLRGYFVVAEGEYAGMNQWTVKVNRGVFGQRSVVGSLEKPVVNIKVTAFPTNGRKNASFLDKTADFAYRTLVGASSAAIPFALTGVCQYYLTGTTPALTAVSDTALFLAGLGLFAAGTTDNSGAAFHRGLQFGAVAQAATLAGGVGSETLLNKAADLKKWSGDQLSNAGKGISHGWDKLTSIFNENVYLPICKWSNGGRVANLLKCEAPAG